MSNRVTIMIDEDLEKKLRLVQVKRIKESNGSMSFSRVVNDTLRKSLDK